jgi:hypothetical protein
MTTRNYLDAAIQAADERGGFDPTLIARQSRIATHELVKIGGDLEGMKLVSLAKGRWQLIGVAREMAAALCRRNVDRRYTRTASL